MISIEERAKYNATFIGNQSPFDAYIEGAYDQQQIDIDRAWKFVSKHCTFMHPRKNKEVCVFNKGMFIYFMKGE